MLDRTRTSLLSFGAWESPPSVMPLIVVLCAVANWATACNFAAFNKSFFQFLPVQSYQIKRWELIGSLGPYLSRPKVLNN